MTVPAAMWQLPYLNLVVPWPRWAGWESARPGPTRRVGLEAAVVVLPDHDQHQAGSGDEQPDEAADDHHSAGQPASPAQEPLGSSQSPARSATARTTWPDPAAIGVRCHLPNAAVLYSLPGMPAAATSTVTAKAADTGGSHPQMGDVPSATARPGSDTSEPISSAKAPAILPGAVAIRSGQRGRETAH
jgi:hypothetical protein